MKKTISAFFFSSLLATAAVAQVSYCDVNFDTKVNTADVVTIYNKIVTGDEPVKPATESKTFTYNGVNFYFEPVEGDLFMMGGTAEHEFIYDDQLPVHEVTVSDFYMARTELTQAQWKAVASNDPFTYKGDNLPAETVSYSEALFYCFLLNTVLKDQLPEGMIFRLPTEAEWEYAARGGNESRHWQYSGKIESGKDLVDYAWYYENSGNKTHSVGQKLPNELGLYDMSGNVKEWCYDWYGNYSSSAQTDPSGSASGSSRVIRGGSHLDSYQCRTAFRDSAAPTSKYSNIGFRLVLARPVSE